MLAHDPQRFFNISSLEFGTDPSSFMDSLAGAFPRLQSLTLQHSSFWGSLAPLAPLASCLTSLSITLPPYAELLISDMHLLSSLRKLVLVVPDIGLTLNYTTVPSLQQLSRLRGLQHFELQVQNKRSFICHHCLRDAPWLTSLATLQLTALKLQPTITYWDHTACRALGALSQLRSLQLGMSRGEGLEGAAGAIARLTDLTQLMVEVNLWDVFVEGTVQGWSALQLSSLTLQPVWLHQSTFVLEVLEAMAVQRTLTHLQISYPPWQGVVSPAGAALYGAGLSCLGSLSRLEALELQCYYESAAECFRAVAQLTCLTSLMLQTPYLCRPDDWGHVFHVFHVAHGVTVQDPRGATDETNTPWDWPAVVAPAAALTRLQVLDVYMCCDGPVKALLHLLPCFPRLRELYLRGGGSLRDGTHGAPFVTGEDLQQLDVLRGTLTTLSLSDLMGVTGDTVVAAEQLPWLRDLLLASRTW